MSNEELDTLYDSDTNGEVFPDDLGISQEEYDAACKESRDCGQPEGHIRVNGRQVYAST